MYLRGDSMWDRGLIVWRRKGQDFCLISLWLKTVGCQQLQIVKLVILTYFYSNFTLYMCVLYRLVLLFIFSILLMFAMISFKSYANICYIIVDWYWFRFTDVSHHIICDICTHCMILLISEFLLITIRIINAIVSLVDLISG